MKEMRDKVTSITTPTTELQRRSIKDCRQSPTSSVSVTLWLDCICRHLTIVNVGQSW